MVVTRAGGIPLVWYAYPGNRPDVTQSPTLIEHLTPRYAHLAGDAGKADVTPATMTVEFDAGQNSTANLAHGPLLSKMGSKWGGSWSSEPSDNP